MNLKNASLQHQREIFIIYNCQFRDNCKRLPTSYMHLHRPSADTPGVDNLHVPEFRGDGLPCFKGVSTGQPYVGPKFSYWY